MEIVTTRQTCIAAGLCALSAPNVFGQNDHDGTVELLNASPAESDQESVREAADICPSASIHIQENDI